MLQKPILILDINYTFYFKPRFHIKQNLDWLFGKLSTIKMSFNNSS